jgi:hypothetical protein
MLSVTPKVRDFGFHVNTVSEQIHEGRSEILGHLFFDKVSGYQQWRLRQDVGDRYSRLRRRASFACPKCRARRFIRKGCRHRVYLSTVGKTRLPIVQVQCRSCGARFCPYKDRIGLAFGERISYGLRDRQLSITCQVPYQRAQDFVGLCLGVSCSPKRIRQDLDREAQQIRQSDTEAVGQVVYQDATKVKAGPKQRGVPIHVAITAKPAPKKGNRKRMSKQLLFLRTADPDAIKERLSALQAKGIVHDGELNLSACAPRLQRCLWHLPHQLDHMLWLDGLPCKQRRPYVKELIATLHKSQNTNTMTRRYRQLLNKLQRQNFTNSLTHLQGAEPELTTSRKARFHYHTTSPVEREMREINRRADIGARWSITGVENLLLVKTWYRLNQPKKQKGHE